METAKSATPTISQKQREQCFNNDKSERAFHAQTGIVRFIGSEIGKPIHQPVALPPQASPESAARGYLSVCGTLFALKEPATELVLKRQKTLDRGRSIVHFQQVYQNVPVIGGELIVQTHNSKDIISVSGEILPDVSIETSPAVNAFSAQEIALQYVAKKYKLNVNYLNTTQPKLWVFNPLLIRPGNGITSLVWRMDVILNDLSPIRELVLIDAHRGSVALSFDQVYTSKNRLTYTANNGKILPGTLVCNESNPTCAGGDSHAVAAHTYAGDTYDFFYNYHSRDSINNAGMALNSTVHYEFNFDNAFWDGSQMVYGDAYGFALADDVVGHEITHGITEYESNLFYYYQSGAINESLSDVWGEFVDLTNGTGNDAPSVRWLVGEDISGLGALRNMQNPPAFSDPDKIISSYYYTGAIDNGGVHTNSGVNNKAAYLMTDGGTFNGQTVSGMGITKVAKIYYEVQTNMLVSGSDYADLYNALYQGCLNLVGTSGIAADDCEQVRNATIAVEMDQQPVSGFNTEAPVCPNGQIPVNLFFDDLESGSGNWTFAALSGTSRWQYDFPYGSYAYSGIYMLYADDYPDTISDSYAAMNSSVTLPANAYLHFAHAYGFEDLNFDGGVLEYSTNGGASWNDAGTLFDYNGYNGTVSSEYDNPLAGRAAFIGDSHGYISSRLNLNSLAGQSVRFRWRMGLDSIIYDWGWWLDDIRIYTCAPCTNTFYRDFDGDGYGNPSDSTQACTQPAGYVTDDTDCDDADAAVYPGATEVCNGIDDNCDGLIDDADPYVTGQSTWYPDADSDGYGNPNIAYVQCTEPVGPPNYELNNMDYDDNDPGIGPPVLIVGATLPYYFTLQAAYDAALDGDTIQVIAKTFTENLFIDISKSITFSGGYNGDFSSVSGYTTLQADVFSSDGTLTIENFIVQP